ncbi:MAG TPA: tripartite tricarboxylate transporter permease [Chloroflexota bacterium]
MSPFDGLMYGFSIALTPDNLLAAVLGAFLGTAVGILPGLSPTVVLAILLVPTMGMKVETGLIMMGGIYFGTQYGDSLSAILMGVPSEAPSVVIGIDGYKLSKKGRAGAALSIAAVSAFIGATIGLVGLTLLAGPVSHWALAFGPPEYFVLCVVGFLVLSKMSSSSLPKALVALAIGMSMTTVGIDPFVGAPRFTFGQVELLDGIELVPAVMGLVGMAEMIYIAAKARGLPPPVGISIKELMPSRREWRNAIPASLRGAVIGFFMGLAPGPTSTLCTFASYRIEQRMAPTEVGEGAVQAVAGPKSADDASISGHLIPLLSLGIPFTPVAAILFAGMMLHGVTPGPNLITERPEVFWGLVAAMYLGNVALLVLNFPLVGMWVSVLRLPQPVLASILVVLMLIGAYSLRNSTVDMVVVVVTGILGYIMRQLGYERTLAILGLCLGPLAERSFSQSLQMSANDPAIFFDRPIPEVLWGLVILVFLGQTLYTRRARRHGSAAAPAGLE